VARLKARTSGKATSEADSTKSRNVYATRATSRKPTVTTQKRITSKGTPVNRIQYSLRKVHNLSSKTTNMKVTSTTVVKKTAHARRGRRC